MRSIFLLGVVCGLSLAAFGCGSSDSGGSSTTASSAGSAPPPPPSAPSAPAAPSAGTSAPGSSATGSSDSASGYPMPGGSSSAGYPGGSSSSGYPMPGGSSSAGYPGASSAPGYPGASSSAGYPMPGATPGEGSSPGYPAGYPNPGADAASGYPGASSGYPGYPGGPAGLAAKPPRPKSLREKAVDAFRDGKSDEGVQLLSAHYLTNPTAGPELGRVMQWSPSLRKPTLVTRIGIAVVYASQPPTFEGHPQPIGSPELDASMGSMEQKGDGGNREGGNPRVGGGIRRGRGGEGNPGAAMPPGAPGGEGSSGYGSGGGQNALPTSPQEELAYFTGEIGTKLVAKIKTKLESGDFGTIYRDALKAVPLAKDPQQQGDALGYGRMMASGSGGSGPPVPGAGRGQPGAEGGGEGGQGGGVITGQLIPGVEFLGAAQNNKELGDLVKAASVDAVIYFEVRVRPATAIALVNNDTKFRLVSAAEMGKHLFSSANLNNKQVYEARKKRGAEDPVAKEIDNAIAALETNFKLVPLPALSPEQAMKRLTYLLDQKPEDAAPLLLEARLFVAKKLLKPDDVVTLALTTVSEEQLAALGEVVEETDLKGKIGIALSGKNPDGPTTPLEKFGAALRGAGGLGNLVPTPQLSPVGLPGALPPGGFPQSGAGGYPQSGPPGGFPQPGAGGYPQSGPPSVGPQPAGSAPPMSP